MASQTTKTLDRPRVDGRHMVSHGKRRISASKQAQGRQKRNEMMQNERLCENKKYY